MGKYMIGLQLLIIGLGTVLLSLFLLSIFLRISGKYINGNKKKAEKKEKTKAENDSAQVKMEKDHKKEKQDKGKKMAAISAAVYQFLDNDKEYKIISIKKRDNSWKS